MHSNEIFWALKEWKSPTISASWLVLLRGSPGWHWVGKPQAELPRGHPSHQLHSGVSAQAQSSTVDEDF